MRSLLDNRKDLTPKQSMESLVKYARTQDSAVYNLRSRRITSVYIFKFATFGLLTAFTLYHYILGYWTIIYPRSVLSVVTEGTTIPKRQYFTPQLYFKDQEAWKDELKKRELALLKSKE